MRREKKEKPAERPQSKKVYPHGMSKVQFEDIWEKLKLKSADHKRVLEAIEMNGGETAILTGRGRLNKSQLVKFLGIAPKDLANILLDAQEMLGDEVE